MKNIIRKHETGKQSGFTLIELLIVVVILAILASIVVPQFGTSTNDARDSAADTTLTGLRAAINLYYQQHGKFPGASTAVPTAACSGTSGAGVATGGAGATAATAFVEQMARFSDSVGGVCSVADAVEHKYGPYLDKKKLPKDPYLDVAALEVIAVGDLDLVASGDVGGFIYDTKSGKIAINHTSYDDR